MSPMNSVNVANGFISVDTVEDEGIILKTKCGVLEATKRKNSLALKNNYEKIIWYRKINNDKREFRSLTPNEKIAIEISPDSEFKIYFGVLDEKKEGSYTRICGDQYPEKPNILGIFYSIANPA